MQVILNPRKLSGTLQAPASKSAMQRACAAALLHSGISKIHNPGISNDDKAALDIIQQLGAIVTQEKDYLIIESKGLAGIQLAHVDEIDCGESGLSMRMFAPICALSARKITLKGHGSLNKRPLHFFEEVLPQLGVAVQSNGGHLPITIKGPLQAQNINVDGSASSQYITGMLMAYSAISKGGEKIKIDNLKSKPYVNLTLNIMQHFELPVPKNNNYVNFEFGTPQKNVNHPIEYQVEGDWSNAAFWFVAGAVNNTISVCGLDLHSTQADRAIMKVLADCNAAVKIEKNTITVDPGALKPFLFDATDCPDLFPPLVVLAASINGQSRIKGVDRLLHKESNRAHTLKTEFEKMGASISIEGNEMLINGGTPLIGAACSSHNDHRIAMALSIAASKATDTTTIENAEAINKSYPDFYSDLLSLGADLNYKN